MIRVTPSAILELKSLLVDHPEDPIIRLSVKDLDDNQIGFRITLEDSTPAILKDPQELADECGPHSSVSRYVASTGFL